MTAEFERLQRSSAIIALRRADLGVAAAVWTAGIEIIDEAVAIVVHAVSALVSGRAARKKRGRREDSQNYR